MKKIYLEFFRGVATLFIIGWHMAFLAPTGHPTHLTAYWGTDALIIFFMLSGLVINLSESRRPKTFKEFIGNRFGRIYPQFAVAILLGFLALFITRSAFPSVKDTIGNFLMVSTMSDYMGYVATSIKSNLPVWSLSFEMAFYVLFAFTIGRYQQKKIFVWLLLSLAAIPFFFIHTQRDALTHIIAIFAFSATWLIGYYVYQYHHKFYIEKYAVLFALGILPLISRMQFSANFYDPLKYFIFAIFAAPFLRYCLQLPPSGRKIKMIYLVVPHTILVICALTIRYMPVKNALAYSTFPYLYMGVFRLIEQLNLKERLKNFMHKAGTITGKYSYSLYISHYTVVFVFAKLVHQVWLYTLLCLPFIAIIAYALENWVQPAINKLLKPEMRPDASLRGKATHPGFMNRPSLEH